MPPIELSGCHLWHLGERRRLEKEYELAIKGVRSARTTRKAHNGSIQKKFLATPQPLALTLDSFRHNTPLVSSMQLTTRGTNATGASTASHEFGPKTKSLSPAPSTCAPLSPLCSKHAPHVCSAIRVSATLAARGKMAWFFCMGIDQMLLCVSLHIVALPSPFGFTMYSM